MEFDKRVKVSGAALPSHKKAARQGGLKKSGYRSELIAVFAQELNAHHLQLLDAHVPIPEFLISMLKIVVMTTPEVIEDIFLLIFIQFLFKTVIQVQFGAAGNDSLHLIEQVG